MTKVYYTYVLECSPSMKLYSSLFTCAKALRRKLLAVSKANPDRRLYVPSLGELMSNPANACEDSYIDTMKVVK